MLSYFIVLTIPSKTLGDSWSQKSFCAPYFLITGSRFCLQAAVHGVAKSWTQLNQLNTQAGKTL